MAQVTRGVPVPPVTEPARLTLDAVVLDAVGFMVKDSRAEVAGVMVGGVMVVVVVVVGVVVVGVVDVGVVAGVVEFDDEPVSAAYNVCTVLISSGDSPVTIW